MSVPRVTVCVSLSLKDAARLREWSGREYTRAAWYDDNDGNPLDALCRAQAIVGRALATHDLREKP